jgi:hypothetical protein
MAQLCEALGPAADNILRGIKKYEDERRNPMKETPSGQSLLEDPAIDESNAPPFEFQPLDGPRAIRILVLHPGSPLEPLRATLQHEVVCEKGALPNTYYVPKKYEAISYTWGSGSKPCSMLLNGCRMPLAQPLFNALVRLREPKKDRRLWADGLCINQEDHLEKASQVALMPQVYTYAAKVLVHLGEQSDSSELIPDLIRKITRLNSKELRENRPRIEDIMSLGLPPPNDRSWKALIQFFCRPWFSRIWIIQEVVLARDVRFFCGDWEMKWQLIAQMGNMFDDILFMTPLAGWSEVYLRAQQSAASVALMHGFHFSRSVVAERLCDLEEDIESRELPSRHRNSVEAIGPELAAKREFVVQSCRKYSELFPLLERILFGLDALKPPSAPILKLLGVFSRHQASLSQDRLYALIGLAGDISLDDFPPNYNELSVHTNTRFARKLVEKGQGMDLLFHATKNSIELLNIFLPSWTPDWTVRQAPWRHWLKLGCAYSQYSGGFEERVISTDFVSLVEGRPELLKVRGSRLDGFRNSACIVKIGMENFRASELLTAFKQFFEESEQLLSGAAYFTNETWPEVQCQTLVAGHIDGVGNSASEALEQYIETKDRFINPPKVQMTDLSWSSAWFNLMPDYAVCKTSKGYVGLIPEVTSATDEIFMLRGSDLPFVLRPVQGLSGYYRFIGGCYMHGLMKGKAWEHVQAQDQADIFLI